MYYIRYMHNYIYILYTLGVAWCGPLPQVNIKKITGKQRISRKLHVYFTLFHANDFLGLSGPPVATLSSQFLWALYKSCQSVISALNMSFLEWQISKTV